MVTAAHNSSLIVYEKMLVLLFKWPCGVTTFISDKFDHILYI